MKKITGTLLSMLLSAGMFAQTFILPPYGIKEPSVVRSNIVLSYRSNPMALVQNPTFSKAHLWSSKSAYDDEGRSFFGNVLWGGLSGMVVGIGVTYPTDDNGFRPTFREVRTGAMLGAAAGVSVGLVTGIIQAVKRKK